MTNLLLYLENGDSYEQEAAATIRRLARERDEARRERDEALDPKLESLRLENGVLDLSVTGPIVERMATAIGAWMQRNKTANYAEMRIHDRHETDEVYIVTVQRAKGKTPHELRVEAEQERDEARAALEWQPIETAPKDGRRILTWGCLHDDGLECGEDPGCEVSWWREGAWFSAILGAHEPTHWHPLPPPPEGTP